MSGQEILTIPVYYTDYINSSVVFSPDGKKIASGAWEIKLWEIATGEELREYENIHYNSVVFSSDGKHFLTGDPYGEIQLWDIETGMEKMAFLGHSEKITSMALSPNGKHIISGSDDMTLKIWDTVTGKDLKTLLI